ncbi:hypothetical protein I4U23_013786 [Adineta vaga]|nr:hypothetical protein I4U23_013786 [Adineta vaga]
MNLTYVYLFITLITIFSTNALPYPSSFYSDDTPESLFDDSYIQRREVFDPYGFNSILSRFVDHGPYYGMQKKRTVRLIEEDIYDTI